MLGRRQTLCTLIVAIVAMIDLTQQCQDTTMQEATQDWWQTAQFYQIYPRSFMDSDGDGIGDLNGITSKLEYLKDIGVTAAWLSPIFTSPMVDFGYDISDFFGIQPEYGTMDDFRELIKRANELDIKILLDFVPNHSSTENVWFKKSVKKQRGYKDFYVWANGKIDANGQRQPPSNWLQAFRGSAWEWNEQRQQYYLHQFAIQQPDLNYRNPIVVETMKRVMRYWLDQGVAGFRVDAVPPLFEVKPDATGNYPDAEVSGLTNDTEARTYLKTNFVENQPETIDMVYQWRKVMKDYQKIHGGDTRVLLIESYAPAWYTMQMYGNSSVEGAELPFNFNLITELLDGVTNATKIHKAIDDWLKNMPAGRTANWVIGNHDQRRAASRYGVQNIDAMNMLVMMLPGASFTYQGEELGMLDGEISWEDTVDPAACRASPETYEKLTRDPERTPFQWNGTRNAGFSTAARTWLPLAAKYETINVAAETVDPKSHLNIYKSLVDLRKFSKSLQMGSYNYKALNDDVFVLKRYLVGEEALVLLVNYGESTYKVDLLNDFDETLPATMSAKIVSSGSRVYKGQPMNTKSIKLAKGEVIIMESK